MPIGMPTGGGSASRKPGWVVGIDIGTQSLKAVVADRELRIAGQASVAYGVSHPQPGWAEQDPMLWEKALPDAISGALRAAGIESREVAALAVAGQLDGCVAVGQDGLPLAPCLIWMDRRAVAQAQKVDAELLQKRAGILADASHMAAKIAWLKQSGSWVAEDVRCFHQPTSYLVSRLTGRHIFDHGLASTTMLYNLMARDYDSDLLEAFGVSREELPEIGDAHAVAGRLTAQGARLTGLLEGVTVAIGTGDDFSAPLGAGLSAPGRMVGILGTAEVVGALSAEPKIDRRGLVETHQFVGGAYFIENPGWLSGGALSWFESTFRLNGVQELDELASRAPAGSDGLVFIPALSGAMAPEWDAHARGCFYGLTPAHGTGHMARAVLEGCAYAMRDVLERLREMQVPVESILLSGGGAKSALWAQIRADVCGLPVFVSELKDTSPIGAAMLAVVAGGLEPSLEACAQRVGQTSARFDPALGNVGIYNACHARYRRLFESLRPVFAADSAERTHSK
jgi:xylulokinase